MRLATWNVNSLRSRIDRVEALLRIADGCPGRALALAEGEGLAMQAAGETDPDACAYNDLALVRIPEATHWIIHEQPARVIAEIERFLSRPAAPRG